MKALSGLEKVQAAYRGGNVREAIRVAAAFKHLGDQRDAIQRAWSAIRNPEFYASMGVSVDSAIEQGRQALCERFGL